jgi:hypothetical protein
MNGFRMICFNTSPIFVSKSYVALCSMKSFLRCFQVERERAVLVFFDAVAELIADAKQVDSCA